MEKIENDRVDFGNAERPISDSELDAVVGGFVISGAEVRGCSNNLRETNLPAIQFGG